MVFATASGRFAKAETRNCSRLIYWAEERAKSFGAPAVCLHARKSITSQARLYTSCGYRHDVNRNIDVLPFRADHRNDL
jgi:hypothetical protein